MPILITVHLGSEDEKCLINANQISMIRRKTEFSEIMFDNGIALKGITETPEQIYQMIDSATQNTAARVAQRLHAQGFIGH